MHLFDENSQNFKTYLIIQIKWGSKTLVFYFIIQVFIFVYLFVCVTIVVEFIFLNSTNFIWSILVLF